MQLLERREDRAALRVPEHHDEPRAEALGGELDAADLRRRDDVAGDADHEQVAEALVEDDLGGHARVRAAEDDGERLLPGGELDPARGVRERCAGRARSRRSGDCLRAGASSASRAGITGMGIAMTECVSHTTSSLYMTSAST